MGKNQTTAAAVDFDERALRIDGKRLLLLSGAIHYPRSTPAMWPELMRQSKEAGLNTVETYVFWNLHEKRRGQFDFSGRLDLLRFCELAKQHELHVIARLGPYVCAEINYGGFPAWLRDVPGMQMRTENEPFQREIERWLRMLCHYLRPMFAPQGGPIIAAQIENEYSHVQGNYGEAGARYLKWCGELAEELDLGIPWVMCEGASGKAIDTINGFFAHEQIEKQREAHPNQPTIWTEMWPGWYDVWGRAHMQRSPQELAYAVARFFAGGGTGVNYYMWHGGTNLAREGMYLQTPSYFGDAPLDEFGLATTRSRHLARLHGILKDYAEVLLAEAGPQIKTISPTSISYSWGSGKKGLSFYCNGHAEETVTFEADGCSYQVPPRSVTLVGAGAVLMNTAMVESSCVIERTMRPVEKVLPKFLNWGEPLPGDWPDGASRAVESGGPVEQLKLTEDATDYCWYTTNIPIDSNTAREGVLSIQGVGDMVHIFLNGAYAQSTVMPLDESRGRIDGEKFTQTFSLKLRPLSNRLILLCCSLGLIKNDGMIGKQNMVEEKKGIWGKLAWNGQEIKGQNWTMQAGLLGERLGIYGPAGELAAWKPLTRASVGKPLQWYRVNFERPGPAEAEAPLSVDMTGMNKGMIYLNGQCLGRYWLIPTSREAQAFVLRSCKATPLGQPTQRYYHLPAQWLRPRNTLTIFEEIGGDPGAIKMCQWR